MDIPELILFQHHEQRRTFALLDQIPRDDVAALSAIWGRLEVLLEMHAGAEERFSYRRLLAVGSGASGADGVGEETERSLTSSLRRVGR